MISNGNLDKIEASYNIPPQMNNLWDFSLSDWNTEDNKNVTKFRVASVDLPFIVTLETETHPTGKNYYTSYTYSSEFSVELREDTSFSVTNYFRDWLLSIFDPINGNFISSPESKLKTGTLTFYTYRLNSSNYMSFSSTYVAEKMRSLTSATPSTYSNYSDVFEEVSTKIYTLDNVRFKSMDSYSLSYDDGEQLIVKANLIADRIYDSETKTFSLKRRTSY